MIYLEGRNGEGAEVVPLALARLEKLIESRLSEVLPEHRDLEHIVRVRVLDDSNDLVMPQDPEFYDDLVDRIIESLGEALFEDAESELSEDEDGMIEIHSLSSAEIAAHPGNCDYFVARMRCQHCGKVSHSDASTHCETFLRDVPDGSWLQVGSHVGTIDVKQRPDYYQSRKEQTTDALHVLEGWECPNCQRVNWAEVVVVDEIVTSIWSVRLSKEALMRAHLISSECVELASRLSGKQPWELIDADIISVLMNHL